MSKNTKKPSYKEIGGHFTKFNTYSKILRYNYMFHKEMSKELESFIKNNFTNKPFDFLDVGCGDASYISKILNHTKINSYTAFDISQEAIEKAKRNLGKINCLKDFIVTDASAKFPKISRKFDVIYSSYALHHFSLEEKKSFFKQCLSSLKKNSYLTIIDLINNYKTRDQCIINLKKYWKTNWVKLSHEDLDFLIEHVSTSDYPETVDKLFKVANGVGFKSLELDFKIDHYAFMIFGN